MPKYYYWTDSIKNFFPAVLNPRLSISRSNWSLLPCPPTYPLRRVAVVELHIPVDESKTSTLAFKPMMLQNILLMIIFRQGERSKRCHCGFNGYADSLLDGSFLSHGYFTLLLVVIEDDILVSA
jgi:hypothetical protein